MPGITNELEEVASAASPIFKANVIPSDRPLDKELVRSLYEDGRKPQRTAKKILVTLNINNYQPAIRALTYPLMQAFAAKIGAEFVEITERKFPGWPTVYEKLQCRDLIEQYEADWCIFFDADALISPELFDFTTDLNMDTVLFNGKDMSKIRFFPDKYFIRDGRWVGACNWFCCASRLTASDLWRPLDDLTLEQAIKNIQVTINEQNSGLFRDNHLIDDYTLSRNLSRYGLKHDTLIDICGRMGIRNPQTGVGHNPWLHHLYALDEPTKINSLLEVLSRPQNQGGWGMMSAADVIAFKAQWNLK